MAAYAALVSLMHTMEQILYHPRPPIVYDRLQMEFLSKNISFLKDFLENYSDRGGCKEALESQIVDAAYAAEDIIESSILDRVFSEELGSNNLYSLNLKKAIEQMNLIKKEVIEFQEKIGEIDDHHMSINVISMSSGSSTVPPPTKTNIVVGFDDVLVEIMDRLTGLQPNLQVLPIIGMGGIGKTSLARNVYDNPFIVKHFHVRVWITISQEYRLRDILLVALFCVTKTENDESLSRFADKFSGTSENELGKILYQSLYGRRYLIIKDDMWSIEAWEKLKFFFPDERNGSRIMITTRISDVSDHFGSCGFKMDFLDEDKSWNLLCKIVFAQDQCCPPELEETGIKITRNCKGLPLSIVVIAGLLANSKKTQEHWKYVAENLNSIVNLEYDNHCLNILYLSYNHLPAHLKPCFLYIGTFPEDSKIRVSKLIQLWVAEGFLKPIKGKSLEVVAEEYLKELIDRNLILIHKLGSSGKIKFCNIHDLLRDLCLKEAQKEKFLCVKRCHNLDILEGIHSQRRISIHQSTSKEEYHIDQVLPVSPSASLTRSLLCHFNYLLPSLASFRLLRVFKAAGNHSLESILQLVNSRYLDFETNWNSDLIFSSLRHQLWNLQTLIVRNTLGMKVVMPPEIWEMSQLKHIEIGRLILPDPLKLQIHEGHDFTLRNLQTLLEVQNFRLSKEVIKRIFNIKKLQLYYVDCPKGWSDKYCLNNLQFLNKLETLACIFLLGQNPNHRIELLQNFAFPHSLKKLTLIGSRLLWKDMRIIGSLPHLQVLKLKYGSFHGPEWNSNEGEFLCLKFLYIGNCYDLVYWTADSTHFPRLEHLVLERLSNLKEIPLDIGEIPTLQSIKLIYCSNSAMISAKNIVEEQKNLGNVGLQVQVLCRKDTEMESFSNNNFLVQTN